MAKAQQSNFDLRPDRKKLLSSHSTYGDTRLLEKPLRDRRREVQEQPFRRRVKLKHRGYPLTLRRALTDFGAQGHSVDATKKMSCQSDPGKWKAAIGMCLSNDSR